MNGPNDVLEADGVDGLGSVDGLDDRGQAFTLESLVAALLLLTALLFALQAVVITPESAGSLDRDTQAELLQESSDSLVTAENDGELSRLVRFWEQDDGDWTFADDPVRTNNSYTPDEIGYQEDILPIEDLGESLNHSVREGNQYNVILAHQGADGSRNTTRLVFQGTPGQEVVTTSYTVTLMDDQLVTGPYDGDTSLSEASASGETPIPNLPGQIYNVVEVRLVVW